MDESVQKHLEKAKLPADLLARLKGGDSKEPRYAWRDWKTDFFCITCLQSQPLSFKEVLRRHGFWDTGIAVGEAQGPPGRPFPLDR